MAEKMTLFKATVESKHKQVKRKLQSSSRVQPKSTALLSKSEERTVVKKLPNSDDSNHVAIVPRVLLETSQTERPDFSDNLNESGRNLQQARMQRLEKLMSDLNIEMRFGLFKNNPAGSVGMGNKAVESETKSLIPRVAPKRKKRRLCEKHRGKTCKRSARRNVEIEEKSLPKTDHKCLRDASNTRANNQKQLVRTLKKRKQRLVLESVGNKLPNVKKEVDNLATRILDSKAKESTNRPEFFKVAIRNLEYQINDLKLKLSDRDAFGKIIQLEAELKQIQQHMLQNVDGEAPHSVLNDSSSRSYELYDNRHDTSDRTADYVRLWMERNMPRPHTALSVDRLDTSHVTTNSGHVDTVVGGASKMMDMRHSDRGSVSGSQREYTDSAPLTDRSSYSRSTSAPRVDSRLPLSGSLIVEKDISFKNADAVGGDAFATVFRGTFQNTVVAVKQLRSPLSAQDTNYFLSETTLLCDISHSCITRILGACATSALPLLVLEYVAGGTLYHRLMDTNKPALDLTSYLRITTDIARGLHYLHHCQPIILHLDLTSRSVLLTPSLRAKITDFGFSKLRHDAVSTKQSGGSAVSHTLAWMAPELIDHGAISPRADVYSYAIILWQMLTRAELYPGLSTYEVLEIVRRGLRPHLPVNCLPILRDLINICWHQDATLRPPFKEVLKSLRQMRGVQCSSNTIPVWQGGRVRDEVFSDTDVSDEETSSRNRFSVMEEAAGHLSTGAKSIPVDRITSSDRPPTMAWTDWTIESSTGRRQPGSGRKESNLDSAETRSKLSSHAPANGNHSAAEASQSATSTQEGHGDMKRHVARKTGDGAYAVDTYISSSHAGGNSRLKDTHLDDCCVHDTGKSSAAPVMAPASTGTSAAVRGSATVRGGGGDTWIDEMIARFAAQLEQHRPSTDHGSQDFKSTSAVDVSGYYNGYAASKPLETYDSRSNDTDKQPLESYRNRSNAALKQPSESYVNLYGETLKEPSESHNTHSRGIRKQPSESMFSNYADYNHEMGGYSVRPDKPAIKSVRSGESLTLADVDEEADTDLMLTKDRQYADAAAGKNHSHHTYDIYSGPQVTSTPCKPKFDLESDADSKRSSEEDFTVPAPSRSLPSAFKVDTADDIKSSTFAKYGLAEWKVKTDQSPERVKVVWEEKASQSALTPSIQITLPQA